ncbi:MAG: DotU family type IV/VI secretion system protein [Planctomycetota bacterium]
MTLLELCEPLFQYMCRLSRSARKGGGSLEYDRVRAEIEGLFKEMRANADTEPGLVGQYEKVEEVLMFFVDSMIAESDLPFAQQWHKNRLAYERNELAGDEKFWDLLDETLADSSSEATERLAIFYSCIGLGFTGFNTGQPELLRKKMLQCSARIQHLMDKDEESRLCPEAYQHTDTRDLVEPPGAKLLGIGIALVGLIIVLFVANIYVFGHSSKVLREAFTDILGHGQAQGQGETPPDEPTTATAGTEGQ